MEQIEFRLYSPKDKKFKREEPRFEATEEGLAVTNSPDLYRDIYTGAKDRKGTKIFVNDIVSGEVNRFEFCGVVKFESNAFCIVNGTAKKLLAMMDPKTLQVHGNQWERPDLLKSMTPTPYTAPEEDEDMDDDDPNFRGRKV